MTIVVYMSVHIRQNTLHFLKVEFFVSKLYLNNPIKKYALFVNNISVKLFFLPGKNKLNYR